MPKESKDKAEADVEEMIIEADDLLENLPPVTHYLSTGCTLLDLAIADRLPGGFGAGRISQIYGDESTAKSVLGAEPLGSAQRQGGIADYDDVEGTLDFGRLSLFGVDCKNKKQWRYGASKNIEDLFDRRINRMMEKARELDKPCAMTIDSLSALCSMAEEEEKLDKATMGTSRSKQLSKAFRKYIRRLCEAQLAVIFIDQTRTAVGQTFGDTDTTSGGRALKFYASTRLKLTYESRIINTYEKVIGVVIGFYVKKNKVAAPFREGSFRLLFDYGIDDIATSLEWLHNNDPEQTKVSKKERAQKWIFKKESTNTLNRLAKKIEDQELEEELATELQRVWRLVYKPVDRKPRRRVGN